MTQKEKNKILLFLGMVIFVTILLALSLPGLDLKLGMPLPAFVNQKIVLQTGESQNGVAIVLDDFIIIFICILIFGYFLYALYKSFKGVPWRELGSAFLNFMAFAFLITIVAVFIVILLPRGKLGTLEELPQETPMPVVTSPLGPVPPILLWVAGIILLVISVLIGMWIYSSKFKKITVIDRLILEAEIARQALLTGHDFKDVIIKCYMQMNLALAMEQGIERQDFMTTREFEAIVKATGIPPGPIHQLTLLFENVRYGHWQSNPEDEKLAIQCLEDIIRYSSEIKAAA